METSQYMDFEIIYMNNSSLINPSLEQEIQWIYIINEVKHHNYKKYNIYYIINIYYIYYIYIIYYIYYNII